MPTYEILEGDCLKHLPPIPNQSADFFLSDPPYPEIDRAYGRLSEPDWHNLMEQVVTHAKRILKPKGSAVFILQPNAEHVGTMRLWLWRFLVETAQRWNLIQDMYWWNFTAMPNTFCHKRYRLSRPSVKYCLWFGAPDCYRNQDEVLWTISDAQKAREKGCRAFRETHTSGASVNEQRCWELVKKRGGTTPFNLIPISNCNSMSSSAKYGHPAGMPLQLCSWWVRYACPPGGTVIDPFSGLGSVGVEAVQNSRNYIGIEQHSEYVELSRMRIGREPKHFHPDLGAFILPGKTTSKTGKELTVYLSDATLPLFRQLAAKYPTGPLFRTGHYKRPWRISNLALPFGRPVLGPDYRRR